MGVAVIDHHVPIAISTLRRELADNEEWKTDPARRAIVIGGPSTWWAASCCSAVMVIALSGAHTTPGWSARTEQDEVVKQRLTACKRLSFHAAKPNELPLKLANLAYQFDGACLCPAAGGG